MIPHPRRSPALAREPILDKVLPAALNLRFRSLLRGTVLIVAAFAGALLLSDFPNNRDTPLLLLPFAAGAAGLVDHVRCMQRTWSWYHGGVLLLIYTDLMVLTMILFFLLTPALPWIVSAH